MSRTRVRRISSALFAFTITFSFTMPRVIASLSSAHEGGGFQPGKTMVNGPGGDYIAPFSGGVETVIDIGPTLKAGGGLELGLKLYHSSKIWVSSYDRPFAPLRRRGPFGVGWRMHLGRVYTPCDGTNCSGIPAWVYESPDGAQHGLTYPVSAHPSDPNQLQYAGTIDGTFIRVEALSDSPSVTDDPNTWTYSSLQGFRLFMGNGIVHTLRRTLALSGDTAHPFGGTDYSDDFRGFYTTKIERWKAQDEPVGQVTVIYGEDELAHCISRVEFRALPEDPNSDPSLVFDPNSVLLTKQREIVFHNSDHLEDPSKPTEGCYTDSIDFPGVDGISATTATYTFSYDGPHVLRFEPEPSDPNNWWDRTSGTTPTEFLLTSIQYPAGGYQTTFAYDIDPNSLVQGEMVSRTLPTGATIKYAFGTYSYDSDPTQTDPFDPVHTRQVLIKTVYLGQPHLDPSYYIGDPNYLLSGGTWRYSWQPEMTIKDPFNNDTVYKFGEPGQAGTVEYYRGSSTQGVLVRTTRTLYNGTIPQHEWTILHDEQNKIIQTQRHGMTPFGQFTTIREYDLQAIPNTPDGLLPSSVTPYRTTVNTFTHPSSTEDDRWELWSHTELTEQVVKDASDNVKRKASWTYESDGRVKTQTRHTSPAADPNENIVTEYRYRATDLNRERSFTRKQGGNPSYGSRYDYDSSGVFQERSWVLSPTDPNGASSAAFSYDIGEVVSRDPNSGVVLSTRDAADVVMSMQYDVLGRPTKVVPTSPEVEAVFSYPSITETESTRTDGTHVIRTKTTVDGLGRVIESKKSTEAGSCLAMQTTQYDIAGRATFVSEWGFDPNTCSSVISERPAEEYDPERGTKFFYFADSDYWGTGDPNQPSIYDPLGRLLKVTTADDNSTESRYAGLGTTVTIASIATDLNTFSSSSTYYEKDAFGNLISVDAPAGADAAYEYSILGELTRVTLTGVDPNTSAPVSQVRSFVYDFLGRLQSATNPESGTVVHTQYDAMGRILQKVESDGTIFSYTYDAAGRPLTHSAAPDPNSTAHPLAQYSYDATQPSGNKGQGKLSQVDSLDETGVLLTRRSFVYAGLNGRLSEDSVIFNGWDGVLDPNGPGTLDKTFRTCMSSYNNLGLLTSMRYPADTACGTDPSTVAKLEYTYTNGTLTGVEDISRGQEWLSEVVYNPAGGIRKLVHGNGRATSIIPDGMLRPLAIGVLYNPSDDDFDPNDVPDYVANTMLWTGLYSYDGAGNIISIGPSDPNNTSSKDWFYYDTLSRLTESTVHGDPSGLTKLEYSFDDFGNIVSTTKQVGSQDPNTTAMQVDQATNRLKVLGFAQYYDQRGNLLGDADKQNVFDERNRLLAVGDSSQTHPVGQYSYDAGGERILKQKPGSGERTLYIRDAGGNVLSELTVPARKYDEYLQKDYFYALGRVIGMAEEKAPSPVQGFDITSTYDPWGPSGSVTISWLFNHASEGITGYRVFRKTGTGGSWVQRGADRSSSTSSFTESLAPGGLANGQTYFYRVAAVNSLGLEGIPSRILRVAMAVSTSPSAPSSPILDEKSRSISIRWTRSTSDTQDVSGLPSPFIGYNIYRKHGSGVLEKKNLLPVTDTVFHDLDPSLSSANEYEYHIRGINMRGQLSPSAIATGFPGDYDPPAAPTGLVALAGPELGNVFLAWNPSTESDLAGYIIYRSDGSNYIPLNGTPIAGTWFVDPNAGTGQTQMYSIAAKDSSGLFSPLSADVQVTSKQSSPAPPNLDPTSFSQFSWDSTPIIGRILNWTDSGSNGVRVYRKDDTALWSEYQPIYTSSLPMTQYTDSSMDWCKAHTYVVRTVDPNGVESVDPNYRVFAERLLRPSAPSVTWDGTSATISWPGDFVGCSAAGNGFTVSKWLVHNNGVITEVFPPDTSITYADLDPNLLYHAIAVQAEITRDLDPPDPNSTNPFLSHFSEDLCVTYLGGDAGDVPDCGDVASNNPPPGGGGGGGAGTPQEYPLRLLRSGPGASLELPIMHADDLVIASIVASESVPSPEDTLAFYPDDALASSISLPSDDGLLEPSPHRSIGTPSAKQFSYSFFHTDHLGSPRLVTDPNGNEVARQKYLPFGEELQLSGSSKNTHKFTGHERDAETGLDYMLARYYGVNYARFVAADPLANMNLYSYVGNNPLVYVDPTGMFDAFADGMASMAAQGHCAHCGISNQGLGAAMASESVWEASCDVNNPAGGQWKSEMVGTPGIGLDFEGSDPFDALGTSLMDSIESLSATISSVRETLAPRQTFTMVLRDAEVTRVSPGIEHVTATAQEVQVEILEAGMPNPRAVIGGLIARTGNALLRNPRIASYFDYGGSMNTGFRGWFRLGASAHDNRTWFSMRGKIVDFVRRKKGAHWDWFEWK